jgi:hypothetical protein
VAAGLIAALLTACGGSSAPAATVAPTPTEAPTEALKPTEAPKPTATAEPTEAPVTEIKITNAVFTKKLSENMEPEEPVGDDGFNPQDTIGLSIEIDGRPKTGEVSATFYWGEQELDSATVDLSEANSGVLFSIGQSTFVGFTLKPADVWLISEDYRVEVSVDGKVVETYNYKVAADPGSPETNISDLTLAKGADQDYKPIDPATEFASDEAVYLTGVATLPSGSWLRADWYVNGEKAKIANNQNFVGPVLNDVEDVGFSFFYLPDGGWADGVHEVRLYVNDEVIDTLTFSVGEVSVPPVATGALEIGDLTDYEHPSGVFSIRIPKGWDASETDDDSSVGVLVGEPNQQAAIFVSITENERSLSDEKLIQIALDFLEDRFGSIDGYTTYDPEKQDDDSILVPFEITPEVDGQTLELIGLTYVEQRGNKISLLTIAYPKAQEQELWDSHFNEIANSYAIDTSVALK